MAKALTAISIEKLKSGPVRREIPDARMPGLYLVVQPSGAKSWAVRYRFGGRTRKLTIGSCSTYDLVAARSRARDALQAVDEGRDPAREKRKAKADARLGLHERNSFPAVVRLFITRHARPKNRSWKEAARLLGLRPDPEKPDEFLVIKGGLVARWKERSIGEITKRDIIEAIDEIVDRGTGTLANRTLSQLRKLFNWTLERDMLGASPCAGLKAPVTETSRDRVLSDDEIRLMWKAAEGQGYPFGALVQLLLLTGQRRQEVAGMTAAELNLAERLWSLPPERTKNGEPHDVPLSDAAIAVLKSLPRIAGNGFIFTHTGTTPVSGFSRAKAALDKLMLGAARKGAKHPGKIKLEPWTLHDLRRTAASGMAEIGIAPHIVEAALNHKSGTIKGVAKVYNRHQYAAEKRQALDAWARRVVSIVIASDTLAKADEPARGLADAAI